MADERPTRKRDDASENGRQAASAPRGPGPAKLVRAAVEQLITLVQRPLNGVIGFERIDDGYIVEVELVDLERVPDTMTILAAYEVEVDDDGELVGYRRLRRYARSQVNEGDR
jgi:Gas vesicle synthesis protein GvpO